MKMNPITLLCLTAPLFSSALSTPPDRPETSPTTTAVYGRAVAEGLPSAIIREEAESLEGFFSGPGADYQPFAQASVPSQGDRFHVWVHYRKAALQMKTRIEGRLKAFDWNWDKQLAGFDWRKVGTFSRSELGDTILFVTPPSTPQDGGIDGIVITENSAWGPKKQHLLYEAPDAENATVQLIASSADEGTEPGEATIQIHWESPQEKISPMIYSMGSPAAFFEDRVTHPAWRPLIDYMAPRLLRLHSSAQIKKAWMFTGDEDWDYETIKRTLLAGAVPEETARMINIYRWPDQWDADQDGRLDPENIDRFATWCADLVRFVNIELGLAIPYWEVTNERDFAYWRKMAPGNTPDVAALADIYNRAAQAMRAVDPTIKLGGPAACSPEPTEPLIEFAKLTQDELDFLSFHAYASGTPEESDQVIYDKGLKIAENAGQVATLLKQAIPNKNIEVHLNEWNICYSWRTPEPRMRNHKGAVYDALSLIAFAQTPGLTAANAWNDTEYTYGKSDGKGGLRPGAHTFHYFNTHLQGTRVASSSSCPAKVVVFGAENPNEKEQAFVLVNRSNAEQTTSCILTGTNNSEWMTAQIYDTGISRPELPRHLDTPLVLPPHSISFFWAPTQK